MTAKERKRLTDANIARLRPKETEYTVWDSRMPGLGVRVRPSGGRSYIFLQEEGGCSRRVSLGSASTWNIAEIHRQCLALQTATASNETPRRERAAPTLRDFVAGEWKVAHFDRYKPSTKRSSRIVLASRILPTFGEKPLDRIAPAAVRSWFDAFSRTAPGGANRTLDLFRQIMNFAIACGYIDKNPTRGVKRNRRPACTRFLSREEIGRLRKALDEATGKDGRQQAAIIRLLLLTGCRLGEIVCLRWSEVREDTLVLADSKTGPRTVFLNSPARRLLQCQPRHGSPFVFPSPRDPSRPRSLRLGLWYRVRREAGIEDARLHDLRHTHASHAVMNGVPVPVVSRLLGHANSRMTLRYAHLADREVAASAERVGQSLATIMGL